MAHTSIQNIVVLMLDNRSYENMLGGLYSTLRRLHQGAAMDYHSHQFSGLQQQGRDTFPRDHASVAAGCGGTRL